MRMPALGGITLLLGYGLLVWGCQAGGTDGRDQAGSENEAGQVQGQTGQNDHGSGGHDDHSGEEGVLTFTGSDALWNFDQPLGEPVANFGDDPVWTETTTMAANRGTTGEPATVIGEVVDVSCYLQLGKRGEAHIPCGSDCVRNGAPVGLVDADNELYVVMAEEHDPRRYGNIALKEALLPFMAKTVQVTGMLTDREGVKTLYVLGYTIGEDPNQPAKD